MAMWWQGKTKNVAVNNAEEDVKEHSVYSNSEGGKIARQAISERQKKIPLFIRDCNETEGTARHFGGCKIATEKVD